VDLVLAHRLTLVVAAPGWGKTTLLRALAGAAPAVEAVRPPAGWTPLTLARHLVGALVPAAPLDDLLPSRLERDNLDQPGPAAALAAAVCSTAATSVTDDTVVLIDDADLCEGDPLCDFLEALVMHLPARLHLVLASRHTPPLRLARLKAAGEVVRFDQPDLSISAADVDRLTPDEREAVDQIAAATGGWPLAVRLAADIRRRGGPLDHRAIVDRLLDPDAVLFEYLAEEVLATASDHERELLALAAHVPFLDAPLLRRLGRGELAPLLRTLGRDGTFIERDHAPTDRYRATLVGGEFVRRAMPPPSFELLQHVVRELCARGEPADALELCTQLGDADLARDVVLAIERPDLVARPALDGALAVAERAGDDGRLAELRGDLLYLRGAWDDAVAAYALAAALGDPAAPRLVRKRATILYLRAQLDDAETMCEAARLDGSDAAEESKVLAWHAAIRWIRGDIDGCHVLLEGAEELGVASGDDAALATVHTTRAMLAALRGDRHGNADAYRVALHHAQRAGDVLQIVRIRSNRGSHFMEEGDYPQALAELEAAIELAELIGSETIGAFAYLNRAETFRRLGRLDDALEDLRRAEGIWRRAGSGDVHYALGELGDVQALRGQRSEAIALYRQAIELADHQGDAQGLAPALIGLARILAADDPVAAMAAAERAIEVSHAIARPHAELVAGWIELRRGDRAAAGERAARALQLAQGSQNRPAVAEALLLKASLSDPPDRALAAESIRLCADLGDPIGEARARLALAHGLSGRTRDDEIAAAEQQLAAAGAWGVLAESRATEPAAGAPPVAISTLGGFRVFRAGAPVEVSEWGSRKARDLVKLLVARRGAPVVREEVEALLWPDEPDRSARRLSVLLSTIRGVLDPGKAMPPDHYVGADHDTVWLVREHIEIDVEQFFREAGEGRRLLAAGDVRAAETILTHAAGRYLGEFCADDPYADWAAGTRELARHTFVEIVAELGRLADARAEHGDAVRHRLRILDVDPYDEEAHLDLVRALIAQRRHGEARRAYRTYCAKLAELDLEPAPFP
jgi:ATP/maltotriose-dependent transcriptional regulator MalT/DNA-binding SARP family transcriptional activator